MENSDRLTIAQEKFIYEILKGTGKSEAYIIAYPHKKKWKATSIAVEASKLLAVPKVKKKYEELQEEFRAREKEKTGWTREQSIEHLRFVIDANRKDIERIQLAAEEELRELQKQIAKNPELAEELLAAMIAQKKKARTYKTNNDGIISAVSELNKMQGYNEQNINMNSTVIFEGDEDLED